MTALWARYRGPVLLGGAFLAVLALLAALAGGGQRGRLDPAAYDGSGAHAIAVLLHDRGVRVERVGDVPATVNAAATDTTVFVPLPFLLGSEELAALAHLPGGLLVVGPTQDELDALGITAHSIADGPPTAREAGCADPVATNAGRALMGGLTYAAPHAVGCYPAGRGFPLLRLAGDRTVLVGSGAPFTNDALGRDGNAALALGLLGERARVLWLMPSPTRAAFGTRPLRSPDELLPHWLHLARWQLFVAVVVLALWRGRRLGRVVLEQLPVVVRASETVEGHGRLYHAARARSGAAEALREGARADLSRLAHGGVVSPETVTDLAARRAGRDSGAVQRLLYGPTPADDSSLVELARQLDTLVHDALTRESP